MKGWFYITDKKSGQRHLFYFAGGDRVYQPVFDQVVLNQRGKRDVSKSIKLVPVSAEALRALAGTTPAMKAVR